MRPLGTARRSAVLLVAASVVVIDQVTKVAASHGGVGMVLPARNPSYALGIVGGPAPRVDRRLGWSCSARSS